MTLSRGLQFRKKARSCRECKNEIAAKYREKKKVSAF